MQNSFYQQSKKVRQYQILQLKRSLSIKTKKQFSYDANNMKARGKDDLFYIFLKITQYMLICQIQYNKRKETIKNMMGPV